MPVLSGSHAGELFTPLRRGAAGGSFWGPGPGPEPAGPPGADLVVQQLAVAVRGVADPVAIGELVAGLVALLVADPVAPPVAVAVGPGVGELVGQALVETLVAAEADRPVQRDVALVERVADAVDQGVAVVQLLEVRLVARIRLVDVVSEAAHRSTLLTGK